MVINNWWYYTKQVNLKTWLLKGPGFLCILFWLLLVNNGCKPKQLEQTTTIAKSLSPVTGITSALEDEVTDLPAEQIAWSTYWKVCWDPYPEATYYQIQLITSEGFSPKLRKTTKPCYRIQMAAGKNAKSQGLLQREMLIGLQNGQLGYKVRAVIDENSFSEWSPVVRAQAK